jgi:hypothetical protein
MIDPIPSLAKSSYVSVKPPSSLPLHIPSIRIFLLKLFTLELRRSHGSRTTESRDKDKDNGDGVEGAKRMLAPPPPLANLGKVSVKTFYVDMTVHYIILYVAFTLTLINLFPVADGSDIQHEGTDVTRDRRPSPFSGVESDKGDKSAGIAIWTYSRCAC